MTPTSVVPETMAISEEEFLIAQLAGLARAKKGIGEKALAYVMDLTVKQLGNIFGGSSTHPKRLWDALAVEPTVLDDVAGLYGRRLAPKDATIITDRGTARIACLLAKVAEAENPDSAGGSKVTHCELLEMEAALREVHRWTGGALDQIAAIRGVPTRTSTGEA